jgi:hypothetical protein
MKLLRLTLCAPALLACLLLSPASVWACACCSNAGDYYVGSARPSEHELSLLREMRFGGTANLFLTEADMEESARGVATPSEKYVLSGSLGGRVWRLTFRDGNKTGTLSLPLPARMTSYVVDIHDGQTSAGGGPLLYKEWRFEGPATGTGIFKPGTAAPAKYTLVLQGRGNSCANAADFTHWRLRIDGRRAAYAFYGELGQPRPGGGNE